VTGSVKITLALALVMIIGIHAHYLAADGHAHHEQRWILLLSLIAKVYVSEALASNINYSGSYEQ
tara:strand:- start:58 stop:252 length:195 start_codon:yes stop_codon:yes gene_type:complete